MTRLEDIKLLQRRLVSSPVAIYQSLKRRAELDEARLARKGGGADFHKPSVPDEVLKNIDEYGQDEVDELGDLISTGPSTAETVKKLEIEVQTLKDLEDHSGRHTSLVRLLTKLEAAREALGCRVYDPGKAVRRNGAARSFRTVADRRF